MKSKNYTNQNKKNSISDNQHLNQTKQTNNAPSFPKDVEDTSCGSLHRFFKLVKTSIADACSSFANTMAEKQGNDPYSFY